MVIPRVRLRESWGGRSRCPHCRRVLETRDLIPLVSFLLLRGRCRWCRRRISLRYPLVELATAVAFLVLWLRFGWSWTLAVGAVLTLFLIALFVLDFEHQIVPDELSLPGAAVALAGSLGLGIPFSSLILGAILGAGFFGLQYALSRGRWVGDGDVRLGLLMGVALGFGRTVVALILAYLAGAVVSLALLAARRAKLQTRLPFGTFLTLATFVSFVWGSAIAGWYASGGPFTGLGLDRVVEWFVVRLYHL